MTPEELLRPRYKVIADYTASIFKVGDIVKFANKADREFSLTEEWFVIIDGFAFGETWFKQYPHLFKPLSWWEDRAPEELPLYVMNAADKKVYITTQYNIDTGIVATRNEFVYWFDHSLHDLLPATEAEYNAYINK